MSDNWNNIRTQVSKTSRKSPIFLLQKEKKPIYGMFVGEPYMIEYEHNGRTSRKVFINFQMTEPFEELRVLSCCPEMFKAIDLAVSEHDKDTNIFGIQKVLTQTTKDRPWIDFEVFKTAEANDEMLDTVDLAKEILFDLEKVAEMWKAQNGK